MIRSVYFFSVHRIAMSIDSSLLETDCKTDGSSQSEMASTSKRGIQEKGEEGVLERDSRNEKE